MLKPKHLAQARSQGGVGGSYDPPPQLPIPKILFHPLAILFHPLAILFHPSAILFHPWNMWMTSHGQCPRGRGVLVNVQEWGRFSNWWRHADNVQGGGAPGVPPIQVQTPPHLAGWLQACSLCYILGFFLYLSRVKLVILGSTLANRPIEANLGQSANPIGQLANRG